MNMVYNSVIESDDSKTLSRVLVTIFPEGCASSIVVGRQCVFKFLTTVSSSLGRAHVRTPDFSKGRSGSFIREIRFSLTSQLHI